MKCDVNVCILFFSRRNVCHSACVYLCVRVWVKGLLFVVFPLCLLMRDCGDLSSMIASIGEIECEQQMFGCVVKSKCCVCRRRPEFGVLLMLDNLANLQWLLELCVGFFRSHFPINTISLTVCSGRTVSNFWVITSGVSSNCSKCMCMCMCLCVFVLRRKMARKQRWNFGREGHKCSRGFRRT